MKRLAAAFFVIALLSVPATALANSTVSNYTKNTHGVQDQGVSRSHHKCTSNGSGSGSGSTGSGSTGSGSTSGSGSQCATATGPGGAVSPNGAVKAAGATRPANASTLPFTGIDVALLAAGGVALLGAGLLVRRFSTDS